MIDLERAEEFLAAALPDRLLAWTAPARAALAIEPTLPQQNGAQRQRAALEGAAAGGGVRAEVDESRRTYVAEEDMNDEPTEEQLREALKQLRVEDVVFQTVVTLVNLSGRRLTVEEEKDVEQAKLGIEAVRALLLICPEEEAGPIRDALSQLQMIYVRETQEPPKEDEERAKARSAPWTPPGT